MEENKREVRRDESRVKFNGRFRHRIVADGRAIVVVVELVAS